MNRKLVLLIIHYLVCHSELKFWPEEESFPAVKTFSWSKTSAYFHLNFSKLYFEVLKTGPQRRHSYQLCAVNFHHFCQSVTGVDLWVQLIYCGNTAPSCCKRKLIHVILFSMEILWVTKENKVIYSYQTKLDCHLQHVNCSCYRYYWRLHRQVSHRLLLYASTALNKNKPSPCTITIRSERRNYLPMIFLYTHVTHCPFVIWVDRSCMVPLSSSYNKKEIIKASTWHLSITEREKNRDDSKTSYNLPASHPSEKNSKGYYSL